MGTEKSSYYSSGLFVEAVAFDAVTGDLKLTMNRELLIELFPDSEREQWRLFRSDDDSDHLVFPIEPDED